MESSNENKATRYAIKIMALVGFGMLTYAVVTIAEGNTHLQWSNVGATLFLVTMLVTLIIVITDRK